MNNGINILTWNARGIRNKKLELFTFLIDNDVHICLVSETWLKPELSIRHSEFRVYRNDRDDARGGGVAIIIKKNIRHNLLPIVDTKLIENIGIILYTNMGTINIYSCYFPGGRSGTNGNRKEEFASDLHRLTRDDKYILGGDFNCRHREWGCIRANCWGNMLHERLQSSYNMNMIYPSEHTYIPSDSNRQGSTLDLFLTCIPQCISPAVTINDLSSDHLPVKITLNFNLNLFHLLKYDYNLANWYSYARNIKNNLILPDINNIRTPDNIDSLFTIFNDTVNEAIAHSVPKKRSSITRRKPFPNYIRNLKTLRNNYRRNWQRYKHIEDFLQWKYLNSKIQEEIQSFENSSWDILMSTLDKGSSPFWNISKILRKKSANIPILKQNNFRFSTNLEKCEILGQTFAPNSTIGSNSSDFDTIREVNNSLEWLRTSATNPTNRVLTSSSQVSMIIKNLKSRKSPGIDGINNQCLKALPLKGIKFLTLLINGCLNLGYFPQKFKEAKVIPIRKPNKPPESPSSYRPISLLSSVGKILEKVIKSELVNVIEANNILPSHQFGFRKEHNTIHPLVRIRNRVHSNFKEQKSTGMVLLDIKAAFDNVWHDGLIHKMIKFNIPIELIKIIQSFLYSRTFKVYIGSHCSDKFSITAGCPQGSCLSPVLYNLYTADVPQFNYCKMSIFADDTAILCSNILATDIISNLESAISDLLIYFKKWKIMINSDKIQAIYFSRKRKACYLPQSSICINNIEIQWENKVKYLGIILDPKLNFKDHIPYITDKVKVLIRLLYPFINRRSSLSTANKKIILKSIFHAIMFYAAPVWSTSANCHIKKLQVVQNKLLKLIYDLPWFYSTHRLHILADVELVADRLKKLTENFNSKCISSEYAHINELVTS